MIIIYIHYISQPKLMKYCKLCTFYPQVHGKLQMSPCGLFKAPLEQFSHQLLSVNQNLNLGVIHIHKIMRNCYSVIELDRTTDLI